MVVLVVSTEGAIDRPPSRDEQPDASSGSEPWRRAPLEDGVAGAGMGGRPQGVRSSARLNNGGGGGGGGSGRAEGAVARRLRLAAAAARRERASLRAREVEDSPCVVRDKCRVLARALQDAKHLVVYTGAGISTAADIPDYRGPRGVWTRLQRGEDVGRVEVSLARPTFTHMALTALWARGKLKFVVSQNCDGLHLRAGLPRRALAELHGDMFAERCAACRRVYLRDFDTTERTARHAHGTRRLCHQCGQELRDSIVHFGERGRAAWPLNWAGALRHAAAADVVLCLGSSLKVLRRYPRLWRMQRAPKDRPRLYIVNLQWTPKDSVAELKINARCDRVMAELARRLRLTVPRYEPAADPLLGHAVPLAPHEEHTTSRPPLRAPAGRGGDDDDDEEDDDEDDLPLRRLQERLRPAAPPRPPPPLLHAFSVALQGGDAAILLRAHHAPSAAPASAPLSDLRRFRMARRPAPRLPPPNGAELDDERDAEFEGDAASWRDAKPAVDGDLDAKPAPNGFARQADVAAEAEASALAAAFIARAVLLCRAQLYPGLHTILAPPPRPPCSWCHRHLSSPRCLWYGAPPPAPTRPRARRTCACCAEGGTSPPPGGPGWYGKGYRKGRRRRPQR